MNDFYYKTIKQQNVVYTKHARRNKLSTFFELYQVNLDYLDSE